MTHPRPHSCTCGVPSPVLTRQPVDEPAQLFLGDIGPAEVQRDGLAPDDAAQHEGRDGLAVVQVDAGPQPLITAPGGQASTGGTVRMEAHEGSPCTAVLTPRLQSSGGGSLLHSLAPSLFSSRLPAPGQHCHREPMGGSGTCSPSRPYWGFTMPSPHHRSEQPAGQASDPFTDQGK